ncbi:hypothetical protein GCM10027217_27520 [Pseudomaricurvus hydrocarbonicus]
MVRPSQRKEMAQEVVASRGISIRLACSAFQVSETCYRNQPVLSSENEAIADWLIRLTESDTDWGFGLCFDYLRNVKGLTWNHKRVYRIYCELALNIQDQAQKAIEAQQTRAIERAPPPEPSLVNGFYA